MNQLLTAHTPALCTLQWHVTKNCSISAMAGIDPGQRARWAWWGWNFWSAPFCCCCHLFLSCCHSCWAKLCVWLQCRCIAMTLLCLHCIKYHYQFIASKFFSLHCWQAGRGAELWRRTMQHFVQYKIERKRKHTRRFNQHIQKRQAEFSCVLPVWHCDCVKKTSYIFIR